MTIYVDTMVFLMVMLLAVSVTVHAIPHPQENDMDPDEFLVKMYGALEF